MDTHDIYIYIYNIIYVYLDISHILPLLSHEITILTCISSKGHPMMEDFAGK